MAVQCAYCLEHFNSTPAFDRHLLVRRMTVTTPKGHVVENEEVVTCRPVEEFSKPMRNGQPRLVAVERKSGRVWVTKRYDPTLLQKAQESWTPSTDPL